MEYVLLLRGINVGGKHNVSMDTLKCQLSEIGACAIETYLNSGNVLFCIEQGKHSMQKTIAVMLAEHYSFAIPFALISKSDFIDQAAHLPAWWHEPMARRDVFFYTDSADRETVAQGVAALPMDDEIAACGRIAVFWGQRTNKNFLTSSLNKAAGKQKWISSVTIRNARTFETICNKLEARA